MVNENDIKFVPKNFKYVFWSWEEYLLQSHGVRRKIENDEFRNQPIRELPEESSKEIEMPNERFELLCVIEFKGDWIKVKYDCFYNQSSNSYEGLPCSEYIEECKDPSIGWLKWRDKNELLVDIFLMA